MELKEIKKEIRRGLEKYTKESPYRFNSDKEKVELILNGLAKRKEKLGFAYCPCRVPSGNKEEDEKIICPCAYHKEEIAKDGICLCGLFVRKER
ncbi:ferredoxin:thioredoxin reductase [bacterium]|nr:ferredoxin:thioredoxin reductase [bacterium]